MAAESVARRQRLLIGRDQELGELDRALEAATAGQGSLVFLCGEAGIGKTSLADAFRLRAEARGALSLWGGCWEGAGAPAFWPWIQVVRALSRIRDDETLAADLGAGAPHVVQLIPDLAARLPGVLPASDAHLEHERFALFDAIAQLLERVSVTQPVVVVLDDLHWADTSSLLALTAVAHTLRTLPVVVVGTYREVEVRQTDVGELLANLRRFASTIPLRGLDLRGVAELLSHHDKDISSEDLVGPLHEVSGGNPFFVEEIVRLLLAEGRYDLRSGTPLPEGVRHVIRQRLDALPAETRDVLRAAGVIGDHFRAATLALAVDLAVEEVLARCEAALGAEVIHERPDEPGSFRFTHALVRDTLVDELSTRERSVLHAAIGEALVQRYGSADDTRASEIAFHFLEGAAVVGARQAADFAASAGARAVARFGYEEGAALYARALDALDVVGEDRQRRLELLIALGEAQMLGGRTEEARGTLQDAATEARALADIEGLSRAALSSTGWSLPPGQVDEELVGLLEEAIAGLETEPGRAPALLARLKVQLAAQIYWANADERRRALADEALALAKERVPDDTATQAYVAVKRLIATWGPDSADRDLAGSDEIIASCRAAGDVALELQARLWRSNAFLELGDLTSVEQEMARVEHMARVLRQPRALAFVPVHRALRALLEGRFEEAHALVTEPAEWWSEKLGSSAGLVHETQLMIMYWLLRRFDDIASLIEASAAALPGLVSRRCALVVAYCDAERHAEARRELDLIGANGFTDVPRDNSWRAAIALLAEACARMGAAEHAVALRDLLAPYAHLHVIAPQGAYMGPVTRALGLVEAAAGDQDAAREHFAIAWDAAEALGAKPLLVRLALEQAELLGNTERAAEGRALAAELGMDRALRALDALGAPAKATRTTAETTSASLSREGDFWALSYGGRSLQLADAKGLHHLAQLLSHPGVEFHAVDLVTGSATPAEARRGARKVADGEELDIRGRGTADAGALLDAEAKAAYKARLDELRDDIEEAEAFNDPERASRAREEMEFIAQELSGAVGLGGRDRRAASDAERARVNATRAIRSMLKRIADHDAELGRLLETTVRTGTFCVYEPDPRHPVEWDIAIG